MGENLRVPAGGWGSCARDSQRWPPRVTVTDKQVSVRHNPSLPPGVRDSRSLSPRSPLHSLPDPRQPGAPGTRRSPGTRPRGEPEEEGDKCHLLRPREELLKSSQATGSKGNSPADARNPSPRHPRATSARPPPAPSSGSRDFSGGPVAGEGSGKPMTLASRAPSPGLRPCAQAGAGLGCPRPGACSGGRGADGRGRRSSATRAGRPFPKVPSGRAGAPPRSPAIRALAEDSHATLVQPGDAPRAAPLRPLGRAAVGPAAPALRVRQRRRRRETGCTRPRPPLRPPRQWKTPGLTALTHAGPPARLPGRPQPRPGGAASSPARPGAEPRASPQTLTPRRRLDRPLPSVSPRLQFPKVADAASRQSRVVKMTTPPPATPFYRWVD